MCIICNKGIIRKLVITFAINTGKHILQCTEIQTEIQHAAVNGGSAAINLTRLSRNGDLTDLARVGRDAADVSFQCNIYCAVNIGAATLIAIRSRS
jgi:hypothetical protein